MIQKDFSQQITDPEIDFSLKKIVFRKWFAFEKKEDILPDKSKNQRYRGRSGFDWMRCVSTACRGWSFASLIIGQNYNCERRVRTRRLMATSSLWRTLRQRAQAVFWHKDFIHWSACKILNGVVWKPSVCWLSRKTKNSKNRTSM